MSNAILCCCDVKTTDNSTRQSAEDVQCTHEFFASSSLGTIADWPTSQRVNENCHNFKLHTEIMKEYLIMFSNFSSIKYMIM